MKKKSIKQILGVIIAVILLLTGYFTIGDDQNDVSGTDDGISTEADREVGSSDAADDGAQTDTVQQTQEDTEQEDTEQEIQKQTEQETPEETEKQTETESVGIHENGEYTAKDDVALYLYTYGHLPGNYLTKQEAEDLGWDSGKGNLWEVSPGACIGGNRFGNYEGGLPDADGRKWYECDVNYEGGYRGAERILYSNDGLIYYTSDHYETFTLLYGEE